MAGSSVNVPSGFGGGLVRYNEEYNSKIKFSPAAIIGFIIGIIVFVIGLKIFLPYQ